MKLWYYLSGYIRSTKISDGGTAHVDEDWWWMWVDSMIRDNPDAIFFLTVETTDIWED